MGKLNTVALCAVSAFMKEGKEKDRNQNQNVFLSPISGKIPNKCMVLAGTVAKNAGIEIGNTYVFRFSETDSDEEYGRQFNTQKIKEASVMDIMEASANGDAEVIDVSKAESQERAEELAASEHEFETQS